MSEKALAVVLPPRLLRWAQRLGFEELELHVSDVAVAATLQLGARWLDEQALDRHRLGEALLLLVRQLRAPLRTRGWRWPLLLLVDLEAAREAGLEEGEVWRELRQELGRLAASAELAEEGCLLLSWPLETEAPEPPKALVLRTVTDVEDAAGLRRLLLDRAPPPPQADRKILGLEALQAQLQEARGPDEGLRQALLAYCAEREGTRRPGGLAGVLDRWVRP